MLAVDAGPIKHMHVTLIYGSGLRALICRSCLSRCSVSPCLLPFLSSPFFAHHHITIARTATTNTFSAYHIHVLHTQQQEHNNNNNNINMTSHHMSSQHITSATTLLTSTTTTRTHSNRIYRISGTRLNNTSAHVQCT